MGIMFQVVHLVISVCKEDQSDILYAFDVCVLLDININKHKPEAVVQRLRRVLERNEYEAKTALQRRSVRIDMSGTTLDVVPVVSQGGEDQPLWIPDRPLENWVVTHPK